MPRFPPTGPTGCRSPRSSVLSRHYDFLPPIPHHFVAFVQRYHAFALVLSLSRGKCHHASLELVTRYLHPGICRGNELDLPSSWGTPIVRLHMFQSDSGRTLTPDHYSAVAWPLVCEKQRLPRKVFRSSIAWLSNSLSTLRSAGYPDPTQDSLPVAGQALLDGTFTRKVSMKGFKGVSYISFPSPKLCLAQTMCPPARKEISLTAVRAVGHSPRRHLAILVARPQFRQNHFRT